MSLSSVPPSLFNLRKVLSSTPDRDSIWWVVVNGDQRQHGFGNGKSRNMRDDILNDRRTSIFKVNLDLSYFDRWHTRTFFFLNLFSSGQVEEETSECEQIKLVVFWLEDKDEKTLEGSISFSILCIWAFPQTESITKS